MIPKRMLPKITKLICWNVLRISCGREYNAYYKNMARTVKKWSISIVWTRLPSTTTQLEIVSPMFGPLGTYHGYVIYLWDTSDKYVDTNNSRAIWRFGKKRQKLLTSYAEALWYIKCESWDAYELYHVNPILRNNFQETSSMNTHEKKNNL